MLKFLYILYIYDIFVIWKGHKYFKQGIEEGKFMLIFTLSILLPVIILYKVFTYILSLY